MDGMWERSAATNTAELLTGRKGGVKGGGGGN